MTNPISKAIVKAAVAMGYGKKSDYKGSSVADVLEKFAAIAKDKGSSGGGVFVVGIDAETFVLDKTAREIMDAMLQKSVCIYADNENGVAFYSFASFEHAPNSAYVFSFIVSSDIVRFSCQSENDYPSLDQ